MGRYEELTKKRNESGLTRDEADELGKLMAERRDQPYGNAQKPPTDVEVERSGTAENVEELEEEKRDQEQDKDVDDSVHDRERQAAMDRDEPTGLMARREELLEKAQREELTAEEQQELQRYLDDVGRTDEGGTPAPGGRIPPPPD